MDRLSIDSVGRDRIKEKIDTRTNLVRREYSYRSLATALESLLGILAITNKSASVQIPL
jgi:hypothetical protein